MEVTVPLSRYLAKKVQKKLLTSIEGVSNLQIMPSQHSPDKACCACWIDRSTYRQLKKLSAKTSRSITDLVETWIYEQVKDVELTAEDHREIAAEIERARRGVLASRAKKKTGKTGS